MVSTKGELYGDAEFLFIQKEGFMEELKIYPEQELTEEMQHVFVLSMAANLASGITCGKKENSEEESESESESSKTCKDIVEESSSGKTSMPLN